MSAEPRPVVRDVAFAALISAAVAVLVRIPLLWDDAWAPGYDGGYYVLQVRSWQEGAPIFADASWAFPVLAAFGAATGDVVVGNKLGALLFGALTAAAGAVAAGRWTRSGWAALVGGVLWATSPGHLALSGEFLKNAAGVAVLGWALATIPDDRRLRAWAPPLLLAALGLFVHKATGGLGLAAVGAAYAGRATGRVALLRAGVGLAIVGVVGAFGVGAVRGVDWLRLFEPGASLGRWAALTGPAVPWPHRVELFSTHMLPLVLGAALWARRSQVRVERALPLLVLAIASAAPGLPFSFDGTAWRLMLHGFVPVGLAVAWAVGASRRPGIAAGIVVSAALATVPSSVQTQSAREPDYAAFEAGLGALRATVPPDARVVAHRGLCGWVWARGDRVCENFDPGGDGVGWWRVVYGVGAGALGPFVETDPLPVAFAPGYTLVPEPVWRRYRNTRPPGTPLVYDERNPHLPRPAFVYGPGRTTPEAPR